MIEWFTTDPFGILTLTLLPTLIVLLVMTTALLVTDYKRKRRYRQFLEQRDATEMSDRL